MDERDDEAWTTVIVVTDAVDAELAAEQLWGAGAAGIEERPGPMGPVGATVELRAGFASRAAADAAERAITTSGRTVRVEAVVDDGLDGWRAHATPVAAPPFLLVPSWIDAPATVPDGIAHVLRLDPGRTFGSGSHPTTRLVLGALARLVGPGMRVLDVGCGSGVLSVAAALLGVDAVGIDVDPTSPSITAANAARNDVAGRVTASTRPLASLAERIRSDPDADPPFDVVLANLLAPTIASLGPDLVAATAPGGHLVLSGLLADRWRASLGHVPGADVIDVRDEDGWVAVVLRRG